jgi:hypothetical protein
MEGLQPRDIDALPGAIVTSIDTKRGRLALFTYVDSPARHRAGSTAPCRPRTRATPPPASQSDR